jgi:hypothetical protein
MNYQALFYWLVVADNAKTLFVVAMTIFTAVSVISTIVYLANGVDGKDETMDACKPWMKWGIPFAILFWSLYILTPSKKDALLIVAGGQTLNFLTTDTSAKRIPAELSNFLVSQIRVYAADANVELAGINVKAKLKEEAKKLSGEELLKRMHTDTTFAKAILE